MSVVPALKDAVLAILKKIYVIDGLNFKTLDEFYDEISRVLVPGVSWGRNLNGLNDLLRGGFGTPEGGFKLVWKNSAVSRSRLGYPQTVIELEKHLERCHPSNRASIEHDLNLAHANRGTTVFDWLVEILRTHGPGGEESADGVELVFE